MGHLLIQFLKPNMNRRSMFISDLEIEPFDFVLVSLVNVTSNYILKLRHSTYSSNKKNLEQFIFVDL